MVYSPKDFYETLEVLRKLCPNVLHLLKQEDPGFVILRSDMTSPSQASSFIEAYESVTQSRFRQYNYRSGLRGFHFKREWVCLHSFLNEKSLMPDGRCTAKISIAVKKITNLTRENDGFLNFEPPLQAVIKISLFHNHTFIDLAHMKILRISREVRESFYEYFRRGIKGVKAKRLHEQKLLKSNVADLNDATINPRMTAVYALYRKWKQLKENVQVKKESIRGSISACHIVNDVKHSVMNSSANSNIQKVVSNFKTESVVQVGELEHSGVSSNVKSLSIVKPETIDDEDDSQLPIIVSCRSLAPDADNTAVPYQRSNVLPSASRSLIKSASLTQSVPLVANSSATVQNSAVVPANTCVSVMRVKPVDNTQIIVYNKSTNSFQVVKYLKLCSSTSASVHSSDQYSSYFPNRIHFPTRVGVQKL